MKNTEFVSLADFRPRNSRLNLDMFTNLEKALPTVHKKEDAEDLEEVEELTTAELKRIVKEKKDQKKVRAAKSELKERKEIEEEADLEKGIISSAFNSYGDKKITFDKTGKELKKMFPGILQNLEKKLSAVKKEMEDLKEEIGIEPNEEYRNNGFTSLKNKSKDIPKRYSYDAVYPIVKEGLVTNERTQEQKDMQIYNDLHYQFCDLKNDILFIEIMRKNLEDKKKYSFTLEQLASLESSEA